MLKKRLTFITLFAAVFCISFTVTLNAFDNSPGATSFRSHSHGHEAGTTHSTPHGSSSDGTTTHTADATDESSDADHSTDSADTETPSDPNQPIDPDNEPTHNPDNHPVEPTDTEHESSENHEVVHEAGEGHHTRYKPGETKFWIYLGLATFCVLFAGFCSGLTVGYLSIDELQLEIKMKNGTDDEKRRAAIIIPIISKHHQLLSTLLLSNALAMECLPIFLDSIVPSWAAVIISTVFVVLFGEVIPQAYCTGPNQLSIAAQAAAPTRLLMFITAPLCVPLGKTLDRILGVHSKTRFMKQDLKALIELHQIQKKNAAQGISAQDGHVAVTEDDIAKTGLTLEETKLIVSTIDLRDTPVTKEMRKIEQVQLLSSNDLITEDLVKRVARSGYSKIPIYRGDNVNNVIGFLKSKSLIKHEECINRTIQESGIQLTDPLFVTKDTSMLALLGLFQSKKTAIAMVTDDTVQKERSDDIFFSKMDYVLEPMGQKKLIGLISLKDIFEEMLETELKDDDVHNPLFSTDPSLLRKKNRPQANDPMQLIQEAPEGEGLEMRPTQPLLDKSSKKKKKR